MRIALAGALAVSLASLAAADDAPKLSDLLRKLEKQDRYGALLLALELSDCARDAAKASAMRPEPKLQDADWRPIHARPTLQQEVAAAIASCSTETEALTEAVTAAELAAIKAAVTRDATAAFKWARAQRDEGGIIRFAPDWTPPRR